MPNRTSVSTQVSTISNQLRQTSNPSSTISTQSSQTATNKNQEMAQTRPPITCHALDTTVGLPAAGIAVILTIYDSQADFVSGKTIWKFEGLTNRDGRVTHWPAGKDASETTDMLLRIFEQKSNSQDLFCTLEFKTGPYWVQKGIKAFFPTVTIQFITNGYQNLPEGKSQPHWHVPLLLGPYTYTTYRGS